MCKKIISLLCTMVLLFTVLAPSSAAAAASVKTISKTSELQTAFTSKENASYILTANVYPKNFGITADTAIDCNGYSFRSMEQGNGATIYQNENISSAFSNLQFKGNAKGDVGIWIGSGSMTFNDSAVFDFSISTVNQSAIAVDSKAVLNLNNTSLYNNSIYDITASGESTININKGSSLSKLRLKSNFAKINIGKDWSGEFEISLDSPLLKKIGTVAKGADISKVTVANDGYYLENDNGYLVVKSNNERAIHFDLSKRDTLYKGSTGFLYGASEINVPTIDLLQGLKPDTMVQKAIGGFVQCSNIGNRKCNNIGNSFVIK